MCQGRPADVPVWRTAKLGSRQDNCPERKIPGLHHKFRQPDIADEGQLGRGRDDSRSVPILGHPFAWPLGKDQAALLYRKRRIEKHEADMRGMWPWLLLGSGGAGNKGQLSPPLYNCQERL